LRNLLTTVGIALFFLFTSVAHAVDRHDGRNINSVGTGAVRSDMIDKVNYLSHSKQIPMTCEGVEGQLILKGKIGYRYTRRWVYEQVGSGTYYTTSKVGQKGCELTSDNADQLLKKLDEQLEVESRNMMIGFLIFFGLLSSKALYDVRKGEG
jgi:hypothetical protein